MEGEAEWKQIVEVVEEQADGALQLEGVDITQPWLAAQSLAMAAANRSGSEFGREHSPKVALSPPQETELSSKPRIKRTFLTPERTDSLRIERTFLTPERTVKTFREQISGARLDDFISADRSFGATRATGSWETRGSSEREQGRGGRFVVRCRVGGARSTVPWRHRGAGDLQSRAEDRSWLRYTSTTRPSLGE